jgi:tRNA pseudouridine65 synthase
MSLVVLYRDEDVIVVDKPAGMVVHRGWANDAVDLLRSVRDHVNQYVYPAHRLDRGASGAVAFALGQAAAAQLGRAFASGAVDKRYFALTRGHPPDSGLVDHPIPKDEGGERVPAQTAYRRLASSGRYSLVEVAPRTGRLHQIRRHMKHLSCPLIGDVRYGKGEHNRYFREHYQLQRLALHAFALAFPHPRRDERISVTAPLSGPLQSCLEGLGLSDAAAVALTTAAG